MTNFPERREDYPEWCDTVRDEFDHSALVKTTQQMKGRNPPLGAAWAFHLRSVLMKIHVDHPYTDPGDGRQECEMCGKWVWLVTHSCKGVPVTDAALKRWQERNPIADARP